MTITTNDTRDEYTASAGQTVFNYTFKIFADTDLNVYQTPAGQTANDTTDLITAYTVAGVGASAGGTITLTTPASAGDLITIVSDIPESRTTDYQYDGDFIPDVVNDDFDRVVSLVKQIADRADRSLSFPESQQGSSGLTLPQPEAGYYVRWNSTLDGFENVPFTTTDPGAPSLTVATLANVTDADIGDWRYVQGYSTIGDGGHGVWVLTAGNFTSELGNDTLNGVYLEYSGEDGSTRAWVRQYEKLLPQYFGAVPGSDAYSAFTGISSFASTDNIELLITDDFTFETGFTFPANIGLTFQQGGRITADDCEVVIGGPVSAGPYHIFENSGTGEIIFEKTGTDYRWSATFGIVCPDHFGAEGIYGAGDDTAAVQAAFDAQRPVIFYRHYPVSQVTITGNERYVDFRNFSLWGIAESATNSVLQIKCGFSSLHNIRVDSTFDGSFNGYYKTGIHWYTNDLATYYPGRNRIYGMYIYGFRTGLTVGAFEDQEASEITSLPAQYDVEADGVATDAPLSESYITGLQTVSCIRGMYMRQSNGKIHLIAPDLATEVTSWGAHGYSEDETALRLALSSELTIVGGDIEAVHSGSVALLQMAGYANLHISGSTLESNCPIYIEGPITHLSISKLQNWGINAASHMFEVLDSVTGTLNVSDTTLRGQPGAFSTGSVPLIKGVSSFLTHSFSPNREFMASFESVEIFDYRFNLSTTLVPLALGVKSRFASCQFSSSNSSTGVYDEHHIQSNKGIVLTSADTVFDSVSAYPQTSGATSGGWTFTVTSSSDSWGSQSSSLPTGGYDEPTASVRLTSISAETVSATSANFNVKPNDVCLLHGDFYTNSSTSTIVIRVLFYKFDGSASSTALVNLYGAAASSIAVWTPLTFTFKTPSDCTKAAIFLYAESGAELYATNLSIE